MCACTAICLTATVLHIHLKPSSYAPQDVCCWGLRWCHCKDRHCTPGPHQAALPSPGASLLHTQHNTTTPTTGSGTVQHTRLAASIHRRATGCPQNPPRGGHPRLLEGQRHQHPPHFPLLCGTNVLQRSVQAPRQRPRTSTIASYEHHTHPTRTDDSASPLGWRAVAAQA